MRYGKGFPISLDRASDLERHSVKWCDDVNFKGNLRGKKEISYKNGKTKA
jgi:hypothetical protein